MNRKRFLAVFLSLTMVLSMMPSLAFAESEGESSTVWTTEHFIYDGTAVTGFSDAGKELLATTTDVVIPDKTPDGEAVTAIGNSAFAGNYNTKSTFTSMKLPSTITSIGNSAFAWGSLTEINLPDGLTSIGTSAFMNNALVSVVMPDSLRTMGDGVFSNNQTLTSVKLSSGLKTITKGCFTSCPIDSIVIPEGVTTIAANAFKGNGATSISLPSTLTSIGDNAFEEAKITEIEIPGSVKSIGKYAFRIAKSPVKLNKLVLHEGLESIAKQAFKQNAITEVVLPSTVNSLAADAFQGNSSTVKVYYRNKAQASFGTQTGIKGMELIYSIAKIGDTRYSSLAAAINDVEDGQTISLLNDLVLEEPLEIDNGKSFALDLNGYSIENKYIDLYNGFLTISNGTLKLKSYVNTTDEDTKYNSLTIDKDVVIDGPDYGIIAYQKTVGSSNYGSTVNFHGKMQNVDAGLWVMGNIHTDITSAKNPVTVNMDGEIYCDADYAESVGIALNGAAIMNIDEGSVIEGATGVEVRAGNLTVNGGKFTGTVTPSDVTPNGNGTATVGAGIAVAQHTTALPINVVVKGGTIEGFTGLLITNPENRGNADKVQVTVEGGDFSAINDGTNSIDREENAKDMSVNVSGGTFSSNPKSYTGDTDVFHQNNGRYYVGSMPSSTPGFNAWVPKNGIFEETYVAPAAPETPDAPVIDNTGSGSDAATNVDASGSTVVTDSKAETKVDAEIGDKIVQNAEENKSTEVVIKAETEKGEATGSTVVLPESTVKALAEKTEASVTIKTDSAEVSLDKTAVEAVAAQAGTDGEVKLVVETKEQNKNKVEIELKLVTSKGAVSSFNGGNVTVTVPVDPELAKKKIVCVYIDDNGKYTKMEGELSSDGKSYKFKTGHFSTYAILEEAEADAVIEEQNKAEVPAVKVARASVKLKAYKGGKLKVTASAKNATGYRVYYKKSTWKKYKTYTKGNIKTLNKTFKKLSKGKYTVKVKAYHKAADGKAIWGSISKARTVRLK